MNTQETETLLTMTQAADKVGVTRQRIYAAIKQGLLTPLPGLPVTLLKLSDVEQFANREKPKGGRPRKADNSNT